MFGNHQNNARLSGAESPVSPASPASAPGAGETAADSEIAASEATDGEPVTGDSGTAIGDSGTATEDSGPATENSHLHTGDNPGTSNDKHTIARRCCTIINIILFCRIII